MLDLERLEKWLLYAFIILLPFNLIVGRIFPALVYLPFFVLDIIVLLLGIVLFVRWRRQGFKKSWKECEKCQRYVVLLFLVLIFFGFVSILQYWEVIFAWVMEHELGSILYALFKKTMSSDPLHGINAVFHLILGLVVFLVVIHSRVDRKRLLQIACVPLVLILLANVFLVVTQQDVKLDAGIPRSSILPYSITETERAYFPFVNSLLLSLYLSCFFFVLLWLFISEKRKNWKWYYGFALFLLVLVLGFTKGRAALVSLLLLFVGLCFVLWKRKRLWEKSKTFLLVLGLFLLLVNLHIFVFHEVGFSDFVEDIEEEEGKVEDGQDREIIDGIIEETNLIVKDEYTYWFSQRRKYYHWPTALALFREDPLFGVGGGMFYYSVLHSHKEMLCGIESKSPDGFTIALCPDENPPEGISSSAHSIYLQQLAENAIVGFTVFVLMLGCILFFGMKRIGFEWKKTDYCSFFLFLTLIGFLIQGALMSYFVYIEMLYLFWFFVGLLFIKK